MKHLGADSCSPECRFNRQNQSISSGVPYEQRKKSYVRHTFVLKYHCGECDQLLSCDDFPPINIHRSQTLAYAFSKRVIQPNKLSGRAALIYNDDIILSVIYEYIDEDEIPRAEEICGWFADLANLFCQQQFDCLNIQYYPVDQAD